MTVRVAVAERQMREKGSAFWPLYLSGTQAAEKLNQPWSLTRRLRVLLGELFPYGNYQLDHDPALVIRKFNRGRYYPDANDPEFLAYRLKAIHLLKTTGRKPGAAKTITTKGSDVWVAQKFRKLEGKNKPRRKQKIASRPFQKAKRKFHV